jgi:hypothetical protein
MHGPSGCGASWGFRHDFACLALGLLLSFSCGSCPRREAGIYLSRRSGRPALGFFSENPCRALRAVAIFREGVTMRLEIVLTRVALARAFGP